MKLTKTEEGFCNYTGAFGILITFTCLMQIVVYGVSHWLNNVFLLVYAFIILTYFFLAFLKHLAPVFLIISLVSSLAIVLAYTFMLVFSLIIIILFMYTMTITVVVYMYNIPAKVRQKEMDRRAEEEEWRGKI